MYKVVIFSVCLSVCLSFVTCDLDKEEGADCEWDGVKGKCVHPRVCLTSLARRGAKHPVCSHKGEETIICCTDCELVNDTSNFIMSPSSGVFWKDGRKSRDACLQYLKELPHKCRQEGYYAGLSRRLDQERKCHTFSLWAIGGAPGPGARIPSENPYEAVVGFGHDQDTAIWMSAGSIIHEKFILTSAHQLNSSKPDRPLKYVALGVRNLDKQNWQFHNIKKVYLHPEYDGGQTRYNDIALLELETSITYSRDILPACLPEPAEEFDTSKAKFTNWLRDDTDPNITGPYDSPHIVQLKEFTTEECNAKMEEVEPQSTTNKLYLPQNVNGDSQVCYGTDQCMYLIGVPIAVTTQYSRCMNTVIGMIAHGGHNCAPTVFTKVKHFTSWIESINHSKGHLTKASGVGNDSTKTTPSFITISTTGVTWNEGAYCGGTPVNRLKQFRCQNGSGCVDWEQVCDTIRHCPDGSDEVFCLNSTRKTRSNACVLPPCPEHGKYETVNDIYARPGQSRDSFVLKLKCRRGYGVINADGTDGSGTTVYCVNGEWSQTMPNCVRFCKLEPDPSIYYMCHVPGTGFKVCNSYVAPGTLVNPMCRSPIYHSTESFPYMKCVAGFWDYFAQCKAECGRVAPEGFALVIDGKEAKRGELPWHVGIYRKTTKPYMQICGGSMISNNAVISAAHCFWSDMTKLLPASDFAVAVGKVYRPWDSDGDVGAQKSDIKEIKIPRLFQGSAANFQEDIAILILESPFVYNPFVRPVCLNYDGNFDRWQLQHGKLGKVAGWGLTAVNGSSSPTLLVVEIPFVNEDTCITALPFSFREYLTGDKFCAGYTNGTALCRGDSGGGLAFADKELGIYRFYLRGVVSTAPRNDNQLCNDNTYTMFTKITKHQEFIKETLAAITRRPCPLYAFQCNDGSCVDQGADCNGKQDCKDGSDEAEELCSLGDNTNITPLNPGACVLPPYPDKGTYVVSNVPNAVPGQAFNSFILTVVCSRGHVLMDSENGIHQNSTEVYCVDGDWLQDISKCVPACEWEGVKGKCVPSQICLSTLDRSLPKQPACNSTSNDTPLICCTDCELIKDSRLLLSNPVLGILSKSGTSMAKDKCLEYIHTLDYPCKKDSSLRNNTFQLDPVKNCFRKVNIPPTEQRNTSRRVALREEFPYMAMLGFGETLDAVSWACGGTIISERFILTAAHCVDVSVTGPLWYMALGIMKRSDPGELWQRYNVKRVIIHPKHTRFYIYHDIALLETDREIAFNSAVLPACLHVDDETETSYGYLTDWESQNTSDRPHSVLLRRTTEEECAKENPPSQRVVNGYDNSTQMCYGASGTGSICEGDISVTLQSRDQEQCQFTIIAILSSVNSCVGSGHPGLFTRVKYYVPWIEEIVWP